MTDLTIRDAQARVCQWHEERGMPMPDKPTLSTLADRVMRAALIREEFFELRDECHEHTSELAKLGESAAIGRIAKEAADLLYTLLGLCCALGIDMATAFEAVCDSNDTKPTTRDATGKIVKGPNYIPPDMAAVVGRMR